MSSKIIISATDGCGTSVDLLVNKKGHVVAGVRTCYDNYTGKTWRSYREFTPGEVTFKRGHRLPLNNEDHLEIYGDFKFFRGAWGNNNGRQIGDADIVLKGAILSDDHVRCLCCPEATIARLTK